MYNILTELDVLDPNILIDIYIKFIIISSIFFILYKYYLIDITIDNIYKIFQSKLDIYVPDLKTIKNNNEKLFTQINDYMTNYSNQVKKTPSNANTNINDTNMIIIFTTMIISLFIILCVIIYLSNGYNYINFINIIYSIIFNSIFIIISQFILFYVIYEYIDPLKLYNFFYYNYDIKPVATKPPIDPKNTEDPKIININKPDIDPSILNKTIIATPSQTIIIDSAKIGTIFIFLVIFISISIIMFVLSILNYLIVYNNYNIGNSIIPFTKFSLIIYILITCVSFLIFIILLMLLLNII
jgi:hypothetical protein